MEDPNKYESVSDKKKNIYQAILQIYKKFGVPIKEGSDNETTFEILKFIFANDLKGNNNSIVEDVLNCFHEVAKNIG